MYVIENDKHEKEIQDDLEDIAYVLDFQNDEGEDFNVANLTNFLKIGRAHV